MEKPFMCYGDLYLPLQRVADHHWTKFRTLRLS
jgi:hypothetical protein